MEYFYLLIFIIIGLSLACLIAGYVAIKLDLAEDWLKKFENGGTVISIKYGHGTVLCIKASKYSAYVEFENFSGWIGLDDLVPIGKHKNKW